MGFGPPWLRYLKLHGMGKQINPSEPQEHAHKEGTPTMGGMMILAPVVVTLAIQVLWGGRLQMVLPVVVALVCGVLGIADDLQTLVTRQRSAGMSPAAKWVAQIAISLATAAALVWLRGSDVHVPFYGVVTFPWWAYVPLAAFVLVATINGVNITDGMDSLAATTGAISFMAFWSISLTFGDSATGALCATVVGALLAYLWFNAHPAQMFMGDTGSSVLGGLLGVVALWLGQPLLLVPVGVIYVTNIVSDILQVASVKLRGKRLFKYAPLHLHFRRAGWPETWVVQRFWIVGAAGALVGLWLAQQG